MIPKKIFLQKGPGCPCLINFKYAPFLVKCMLTETEINEIRGHLEKAQNPLFFFDNDADGLCSFLLLRRAIGRGKGVAIKSFPDLNTSYARKARELKPDYIFILDKPIVSDGFLKEIRELNLPVVWIDHHEIDYPKFSEDSMIYYYNSMKSEKPSPEPVSFLCYKVAGRQEDLWIAMCGCIGDAFLPDFAKDAEKKYAGLWKPVKTAFEGLYETELGRIARVLSFALKDRTSNVIRMLKFMCSADINDVLEEERNGKILSRFSQISDKYKKLIDKAISSAGKEKLLYFQYGGDLSISADIANELSYKFPDKVIVVDYIKGNRANISLRGKNVKEMTMKAMEGMENATGGGHKDATGAQMNVKDLPKFKENLEKLIK